MLRLSRRRLLCLGLASLLAAGPLGCQGGGNFSLLGYTTKPNYDTSIRTVFVPIFQTQAFAAGPFRRMEMDLTRVLIREIEAKTPYKVVSYPSRADTELLGTIVINNKNILNRTQLNEVRQGEVILVVQVVWRDLRTGNVLSNRWRPPIVDPASVPQLDPNAPPIIAPAERANPVSIQVAGRFIPELGESTTTGIQMAVERMATQIVSLMEVPWDLPGEGFPPQ